MNGLCQCGCGLPAPIAARTVTSRGRIKGQPLRYIRGHNSRGMNRSKPYKTERYVIEDRGHTTPCWIWNLKISKIGYGVVRTDGRDLLAHRHYYEQAHGPIPEGMQIDHLCRQRACVNPDHLEAVTPIENSRRSRATKLSQERAGMILALLQAGYTGRSIARVFNVSPGTVYFIKKNGVIGPRNPTQRRATGRRTATAA